MNNLTECDAGHFGLMCKDECSPNCEDSLSCDHVTGSCDGGCKDGWTGLRCENGMYSLQVKQSFFFRKTYFVLTFSFDYAIRFEKDK